MSSSSEPFFPSIFNVLHDGTIVAIHGTVPGDLQLEVEIDYLRRRFADSGKTFRITLTNCTRLAYRDNDDNVINDLAHIAVLQPEILSTEMRDDVCLLYTGAGVLEIQAINGALALDSGRTLSLQALLDVAEAYWQEFDRQAGE